MFSLPVDLHSQILQSFLRIILDSTPERSGAFFVHDTKCTEKTAASFDTAANVAV